MANSRPIIVTPKTKKRVSLTTSSGGTAVKISDSVGEIQVLIRSISANAVDGYLAFGDSQVSCDPTKDDGFSPGSKEVQTVISPSGGLYVAGQTETGTATIEVLIGSGY